jgi:lauroyl/myristoyl acyltransferase
MNKALAGVLVERLASTLPPARAYAVAARFSGLFLRGKTKRLLEDTRNLFPEKPDAWVRDAVRRQRHHRAWVALDKYMLTRLTGPEVVAMHDAGDVARLKRLVDERLATGAGGVIYTLHYGRPAWSPFLFAESGYAYVGLTRGEDDTGLQGRHAEAARARGATLVEAGDLAAGVHAFRGLKQGKLLFVLIDGSLTQKPTMVDFLGRRVPFSLGFAQLARRTGAWLMAGVTHTGADPTKLRISAAPVELPPDGTDADEFARRLVAPLESMVLADVGQWYGINRLFRQARRLDADGGGGAGRA